MTDKASPVHKLAVLAIRTAQCLRGAAAVAMLITYRIIQANIVSGDRLAGQLVGIGILGGACVALLLLAAHRLVSAAHAAANSAGEPHRATDSPGPPG